MSDYEVRAVANSGLAFILDDGRPRIDGRAIVYGAWSEDLGGFRERMMPGSVELDPDLLALFDHDTSTVLGRLSAGTMRVTPDQDGIAFSAFPPDTQWARDMRVSMDRGDIKGCSYRMLVFPGDDKWYVQDGEVRRDVNKAHVSELTVTSMPAYPQTSAEARSRAAVVRATSFGDTLTTNDTDRLASWSRYYQLESALVTTIMDGLEEGDQPAAEAAIIDFATACTAWLRDHLTRFTARYPMPDYGVVEAYSLLRSRLGVATQLRAGRVLSDANEQVLKDAVEMIETAGENIESVIAKVDPSYVDDDDEDTTAGPDAEDGSSEASRSGSGGAPGRSESLQVLLLKYQTRREST